MSRLYGRQPRLKTPEQLCAELDAIVAQPAHPAVVYFVLSVASQANWSG
jgi:hypothetical protein